MPQQMLQVVISSTTKDLTEHRAKAINAILRQGMYPIGMEHSIAPSNETPLDASLALIDQADVYVGIIGFRYGHIPPEADVSITQLEYQRAMERNIPRLIFVADESHEFPDDIVDEPDLIAEFRDHVLNQQVAGIFTSSDDFAAQLLNSLSKLEHIEPPKETPDFSPMLRDRFAELNKDIKKLTDDQYQIIDMFKSYNRLAINGCAGSGKTLLAIEKAMRLSKNTHYRTLILCHSPHLATFLEEMTFGTNIETSDFVTWIRRINQDVFDAEYEWTHYEEPTQTELDNAFFFFAENPDARYHAIIVDEGQDFDKDWWVVVEAALVDVNHSLFYIFYDEQQKLRQAKIDELPIAKPHPELSKNCRNAGEVFKLVRQFRDQGLEGTIQMDKEGLVRKTVYLPDQEKDVVQQAVLDALEFIDSDRLAVLTTEFPPATDNSIFHNHRFHHPPLTTWQDIIYEDCQTLIKAFSVDIDIPRLSNAPLPTDYDFDTMETFADFILKHGKFHAPQLKNIHDTSSTKWESGPTWMLERNHLRYRSIPQRSSRLMYFKHRSWASDIPAPEFITISAEPYSTNPQDTHIRLSTVSTFKGLEVDGAILFVRTFNQNLRNYLYVGTSRPRLFLHVIIDRDTNTRYSRQFDRYDNYGV